MKKLPRKADSAHGKLSTAPLQEQIVAYLAAHAGPVNFHHLTRVLGLHGMDKREAKHIVRALADAGNIRKDGRKLLHPKHQTALVHVRVLKPHREGGFMAESVARDGIKAIANPVHLLMQPPRGRKGISVRTGYEVLAKLQKLPSGKTEEVSARVLKIISKPVQKFLAHVDMNANGSARISPTSKRHVEEDFLLTSGEVLKLGLQQGDVVEMEEHANRFSSAGRFSAVRKAGNIHTEFGLSQIALEEYDLPHEFPPEVEKAVKAMKPVVMAAPREDWRQVPFVTIDPIDAKDHDDAVAARWDEDPKNVGGFIIDVAIADVAAYLKPNTALDDHARLRGNSIYFPGRVVPMLPEKLSNDLCSLRPLEDRPALAMRMVFNDKGLKMRHSVHRIAMRSHAKLAYEHAQAVFDGGIFDTPLQVKTALGVLFACYQKLAHARDARGPLNLELPERKIKLTPQGTVAAVITPERLEAHKLIEECMIQANVAAAELLEQHKTPLIYRCHDIPTAEKLMGLKAALQTLQLNIPAGNDVRPTVFNRILRAVHGKPYEHMVNELVLRSQAQAEYTAQNYGHFGLNLRKYAHFTSPIRRYADVMVHRALIRAAGLGDDGLRDSEIEELPEIATHISATERKAIQAERDTSDRLIAHYLADRVGAQFTARISGLNRAGLFVRLSETGADGFIPRSNLGFGYNFDEKANIWRGRGRTQRYEMGMPLEVELIEAFPMAGALRFSIVGQAVTGSAAPRVGKANAPKNRRYR